ncbi:MAG: hypothetical protein Q7T44_16765 [Parvibaculum sp.]|nr:hypothetical protein [Parvibaculum sp.]
MTRFQLLLAGLLALVVAPALAADASDKTFTHQKKLDLSGFYMPVKEIRVGAYVLHHIAISTEGEFKAYEATKTHTDPYAPVMAHLDDTSSKTGTNELGQTYYEKSERLLPTSYAVSATKLAFTSTSKTLGAVTFTGKPDVKVIKAGKASLAHVTEKPALTGTLTIGKTTFKDAKFIWWGGE